MRTRVTPAEEATVDVKFCLMFPRESLSVPVMRRVLGDTLSRLGVDEDCIGDLLLAVTEACTNVLQHGGPSHRYEVVASIGRGGCLVEVLDSGRGFDPGRLAAHRLPAQLSARHVRFRRRHLAQAARPGQPAAVTLAAPSALHSARSRFSRARRSLDDAAIARLPESGRGLAIMRACVDNVTLSTGPGRGTVVSLEKRLQWRRDAPLAGTAAGRLRDAG
jgi:anti-sigma regulatory factor (Ser/Thr protein kinase)